MSNTFYTLFNNSGLLDTIGPVDDSLSLTGPVSRKNAAFNTVNNRMEFLEDVAKSALVSSYQFVEDMQDLVKTLQVPSIADLDIEGVELPSIDYTTRPALGGLELDLEMPDAPPAPELKEVSTDFLEDVDFPVFSLPDVDFYTPPRPDLQEIGVIPEAPSFDPIEFPVAPEITLPDLPTLSQVIVPSPPDVFVPDFNEDFIPDDLMVPGGFTWGEPTYTSDIWAELLAKVLDGIMNGGTGLNQDVEDAIYWQHLNRANEEKDKAQIEAENYFAGRGFTLPTGMLSSKLTEVARASQRDLLQASKEIMVNQAELAQKNTHFIMEQGAALEGMMRDFFVKNATLSLEGQKAIVGTALEIFKANVDRANFRMEVFKTKASVWETRVKAALTQVEIFKAQVEGAKVTAEVQKLMVDVYMAQVGTAELLIKIYTSQMQAAAIVAEVQKAQAELYSEKIKAYMATVEMNKARVLQYEAEWSGEKAKADVFSARVQAYSAEVAAKSSHLNALISKMNAKIEENKMFIEQFKANVGRYGAEVDAKAKSIGAKVDGFKALAAGYEAETSRDESYYKSKAEEIRSKVQEAGFRLQHAVAKIESSIKAYQAVKQLETAGTEGVMNVGAQLAAAAVQGINTSASLSYNAGDSYSASDSNSFSKIISENRQVIVD
jgi:hypothetical protein